VQPKSGWPRSLLAKVKQQGRGFTGFFEVGGLPPFLEKRPKGDPKAMSASPSALRPLEASKHLEALASIAGHLSLTK
jgi:hypothetical protein